MNVFQVVKENITTRQAAESYGIKVGRNGMAKCPFHEDKTPSMKVDTRFHCFGCGEDGDVIDFTSKLYGLSLLDAAMKLASDFGLNYDNRQRSPPPKSIKRKLTLEQQFRNEVNHSFRVLSDYLHLMKHWKEKYAPQNADAEWHSLFVEALQNMTYVEYQLDILLAGSIDDKAQFIIDCGKEVENIERRIKGLATRQADAVAFTDAEHEYGNRSGGKKLPHHDRER